MTIPEMHIDSCAGGRLTPEALLRSEGSVDINLGSNHFPKGKHCFFHIAGDDFFFNLGFINGELIFQRRQYTLKMSESFFKTISDSTTIIASWTMDSLILLLGHRGYAGEIKRKAMIITPVPVPASLISWVRRKSLTPVIQYSSEADFVSRVHSCLAGLQDKIDAMPNRNIFWDIQTKANKIISRRPKKELDLHAIIQALLADQFFLSSIDVLPEVATGAGNIDFLFVGFVQGIGLSKVCAEFKLAHSSHLYDGIEHQLPAYMRSQRSDNGTYCILDFRGEHFAEPTANRESMNHELAVRSARGWPSRRYPIKIHHFYFGRSRTASRL